MVERRKQSRWKVGNKRGEDEREGMEKGKEGEGREGRGGERGSREGKGKLP